MCIFANQIGPNSPDRARLSQTPSCPQNPFLRTEMYLELNESAAESIGKMIFKEPPRRDTDPETQRLLQDIPVGLRALPSPDTGMAASAISIRTTMDGALLLPSICQYPAVPAGSTSLIRDYFTRGLWFHVGAPVCNSLIFPERKPNGALAGVAQWIVASLQTERSLVRFPSGQVPGLGARSPVRDV